MVPVHLPAVVVDINMEVTLLLRLLIRGIRHLQVLMAPVLALRQLHKEQVHNRRNSTVVQVQVTHGLLHRRLDTGAEKRLDLAMQEEAEVVW